VKKKASLQHRFGNMAGLVLNPSLVFQLKFSARLKFCALIYATSPSPETFCARLKDTNL